MKKLAIFASGNGSNFKVIYQNTLNGIIPAEIKLFVSDQPTSKAASFAKKENIPSFIFNPNDYPSKAAFESEILTHLKAFDIDLIILAGYMRLIGPNLVKSYQDKIMNIHPSLLPKYKGLNAIQKAWDDNAKETGVSIHMVDELMDHGRLIMQETIKINHHSIEALTEAIHKVEHRLYTKAINKVLEEME